MIINYKAASAGYIGHQSDTASVNSKYYYHFFNALNNTSIDTAKIITFPQRIPRSGFFNELCKLETLDFKIKFAEIIGFIEKHYDAALNELNNHHSDKNARTYLNWSYLLSRYGRFEKINKNFPDNYCNLPLEISLLNESNKIQILLSNDDQISIDGLLKLAEKFINDDATTDREKLLLVNQILVNYYRHDRHPSYNSKIFELAKYFLNLIRKFNDSSFLHTLYSSIAYRGIAMVSSFGQNIQEKFLSEAEQLARSLHGNTALEKMVSLDNLCTCLQTMSKWRLATNKIKESENYLLEMIEIDPYDSTAYTELGFFYLKIESYEKAAEQFQKALNLGPPGAGMNAYYYAQCLEKLGDEHDAVAMLYQSTELDNEALSPWIDLMNYFISKSHHKKAIEIAKHISKSPILMEQLEQNEAITIQNLIN